MSFRAWVIRAAIVAGLCSAGAVRAAVARELGPSEHRAVFAVFVNEIALGDKMIVLRRDDALVKEDDLADAGLERAGGTREDLEGESYVSLQSASGSMSYTLDEDALELRISAAATQFATRHIRLRVDEPPGTRHPRNTAAFFNYAGSAADNRTAVLAGEFGLSIRGALFTSTAAWTTATNRAARGLSTLTFDDRRAMRRISVGDTAVPGTALSGGVVLAGIGISREFSLDPYFAAYPQPTLTATAATPSVVEVYVNDRLTQRTTLAPGVFDVSGVPVVNGPGQTRVVIRDAFGRTSEVSTNYYTTTTVLGRGLQDYRYAVGFRRAARLDGTVSYGDPVGIAQHRIGVSNHLTIGGTAEVSRGLVTAGGAATVSARGLGQLEVGGLFSTLEGTRGHVASLGWSYAGRPVSLGASVRATSAHFASAAFTASGAQFDAAAFAGFALGGRASMTLQQQHGTRPSLAASGARLVTDRSSAALTVRLQDRTQILVNLGRNWGATARATEVFVGLSFRVGPRSTALVSADRRDGTMQPSVELQQARPLGEGLGYRVRASSLGQPTNGSLQYAGRHGLYEVETYGLTGSSVSNVNVSGGIVLVNKTLAFTRTVEQGFAMVRVPGVAGVRVRANNLEVGRTDSRGNLLVPTLLPNYANRITIDDVDLPSGYTVPETEQLVAPRARGGASLIFRSQRMQAVSGRVALSRPVDGSTAPAGGTLRIISNGEESPLGLRGEFFFEQLEAGTYEAEVRYLGQAYRVQLVVPSASEPWVEVGVVTASPTQYADPARRPSGGLRRVGDDNN